jgi:hypothetical protein
MGRSFLKTDLRGIFATPKMSIFRHMSGKIGQMLLAIYVNLLSKKGHICGSQPVTGRNDACAQNQSYR